ncbi:MAG: gliding motility-associated C-terminal domain-containing protein [Bacteroidia bacterium]|nr:gliding motility-associated C-terminal domain-containing protein [Bacteroidia bacterium]MDW8159057.1 gliding motility-associated C-terminal domain-containing protein [Bacteroidia bacterium]
MKFLVLQKKIGGFFLCICFLCYALQGTYAQDTLYYQGFERDLCLSKIHGFKQYNNLNHLHQNVWAKGDTSAPGYAKRASGINAGTASRFRLNRWPRAATCFPDTNRFDTCTQIYKANFWGKRGAHIITGAEINGVKTYLLNEYHTGYHTGGGSISSETNVGLYDPKAIYKPGIGMVRLHFWTRCNGEEDRDYGLVRYSLVPELPNGELADNEVRTVPINGIWNVAQYDNIADSVSNLPGSPIHSFAVVDKTKDLQKQKLQNIVNWTRIQYTLPPECAHSPHLRIGYFWINDNNGKGAFPALTLDEILIIGYPFVLNIDLESYCLAPGSSVPLSFYAHKAIYEYQPGGAPPQFLIVELSDDGGQFNNNTIFLSKIPLSRIQQDGELLRGNTNVSIPLSVSPGTSRKIRIRFEHNNYYAETPIFPLSNIFARIIPPSSLVCPGAPLELKFELPNGNNSIQVFDTSITWYLVSNPKPLARGRRLFLPVVTPLDTGKYYAKFTYRNSMNQICEATSSYAQVQYRKTIPVTLRLPKAIKRICRYDTVQLSGGIPLGGKYSYSLGGANFIEKDSFTDAGLSFQNFQYVIRYTVYDSISKCDVSAFDTIAVLNIPLGQIISASGVNIICNEPILLLARLSGTSHSMFAPDTVTYEWVGRNSNTFQVIAKEPGVYEVKVGYFYKAKNGLEQKVCFNKPELRQPLSFPPIEIGFEPQTLPAPIIEPPLSVGDREVKGRVLGIAPRTTVPDIVVILNGQEVGIAKVRVGSRTWALTLPRALQSGDEVRAYAIIKPNCKGSETRSPVVSQVVKSPDEIRVYTAFSPNGDGFNDVLEIENIQFYKEAELVIYNRWGQEVFRAKGYQNNWNGDNLPDGTYYYILDLKDGKAAMKGYITILR